MVICLSRAMGGTMSFEDSLSARLNIIGPSHDMIKQCLAEHPVQLRYVVPFSFIELI